MEEIKDISMKMDLLKSKKITRVGFLSDDGIFIGIDDTEQAENIKGYAFRLLSSIKFELIREKNEKTNIG